MANSVRLTVFLAATVAAIPTFNINLDLPPEVRFANVTQHFRQEGLAVLAHMMEVLKRDFADDEVRGWVEGLKAHVPEEEEFKKEIQGTAKDLDGQKWEELYDQILLFNAAYELEYTYGCSGILAADVNGTVIHGRNLDFVFKYKMPDGAEHDWPDLAYNAVFYQNGQQLMVAPMFALYNGIHTGMRLGAWSFEQNTRHSNDHKLNLEELKRGGHLYHWWIRKYMQEIPDFEEAIEKIRQTHWAAPQYFIMAGAGRFQGIVITQDRGTGKSLADTPELQRLGPEAGIWNILQTNDDANKMPDDPRRPLAKMVLSREHQHDVNTTFMWKNILQPALNLPFRVFSWVGVPRTGYWFTVLRNETVPLDTLVPPAPALHQGGRKIVGATKWARQALLSG